MGLIEPLLPKTTRIAPDLPSRNFGLTGVQYDVMLGELQRGNEELFERVFLSQFEAAIRRLKKNYRTTQADAYDTVMWSLLRFRESLVGGKIGYGNLEGYFQRIVTNCFLKKQERQREFANTEMLATTLPDADDFLEKQFSNDDLKSLDLAWEKLCGRCRTILQGFYYDNLDHKTIAELVGDTNEATTRQRKRRCIEDLRGYFYQIAGKN
jgi:RNA polymerase sigma factor (sigma-70 family)